MRFALLVASIVGASLAGAAGAATLKTQLQTLTVADGATVSLAPGKHGMLIISGMNFTKPVIITSATGGTAEVSAIEIHGSSNITFDKLRVWGLASGTNKPHMIRTAPDVSNVTFSNLDVRTTPTSNNYASWAVSDWTAAKRNGAMLEGNAITLRNSTFAGVFNGVITKAPNSVIEGNTISGFSGDGMRPLNSNIVMRGNTVENCFHPFSGTHNDALQAYTGYGIASLADLVLENNVFVEWSGLPANSLRCKMQGISLFRGPYKNIRIENNIIKASAYHGIAVYGGDGIQIRQNTVVNASGVPGKSAWIWINERAGVRNSVIANNLTNFIKNTKGDPTKNFVVTNNVQVTNFAAVFQNPSSTNLALTPGSPAVDRGNASYMTAKDITGAARFRGKAPDVGALENY